MNENLKKLSSWLPLVLLAAAAVVWLSWDRGRREASPSLPGALSSPPASPGAPASATAGGSPAFPSPAAAPRLSPEACRRSFDLERRASEIDVRLAADASRPGVDAVAVRQAMLAHAACAAFARSDSRRCSALSPLSGVGQAGGACLQLHQDLSFWVRLNSGAPLDPGEGLCRVAEPPSNAAEFCRALSSAWTRRADVCRHAGAKGGPAFKAQCAQLMPQIQAPSFSTLPGQGPGVAFGQLVRHHFWNRTAPKCDAAPLGGDGLYMPALRRGACYGIFEPARCDGLLEPVKTYYCGG